MIARSATSGVGTRHGAAGILAVLLAHFALPPHVATGADEPRGKGGATTTAPKSTGAKPIADQMPDVKPLAIVGGLVHPVTSPDLPGGTVLLRDGRIEAVLPAGRARSDWAARGYEVIIATGRHVYPGFVAAGADGIGLSPDAGQVGSGEDGLSRRVADSFDAWHDDVELAASAGITTALVYRYAFNPKSPLGGRAALLKMSYGEPRGVALADPAAVLLGPRALSPDVRPTLRRLLDKAREDGVPDADDEKGELFHAIVARDIPVFAAADTAADVAGTLDLAREERLRVVFYLSTEAWVLADRIATARGSAVQHVRTSWSKTRADRRTVLPGGWRFDAATRLRDAGVPVAILPYQDAPQVGGIAGRDFVTFPLEAAFAQRAGFTAQQALEAITIVPARILSVEDRVGSLEAGKDADVIVADGDVLDYRTYVRTTIVNGKVVYRAEGNRWWGWCIERRDRALASSSSEPPAPGEAEPAAARALR